MPVKKSGKGYQYGDSGKVYTGPGAKAKAEKQGRAIRHSQAEQAKKKKK